MGICHATPLSRQRGSAIVFAMGISLLVVALSAALLLWLTLDIRRVQHLQDASQRIATLEAAEAMAAEKIKELPEGWDKVWEMDIDGIKASAQLQDLSGRLNINTLFAQEPEKKLPEFFTPKVVLGRLLETMSVKDAEKVLDEITADNHILLGVNSIPELAAAKTFLYGAASEHQQVNVNTATPEVLSSILGIPASTAVALIAQRPYTSVEDLNEVLKQNQLTYEEPSPVDAWLTIEGTHYVLETTLVQRRTMRIYSVFHRDDKTVTLMWRSWGTLP